MNNRKSHNVTNKFCKAAVSGLSAGSILLLSHAASAAPGTLADSPLFLSTNVQPNIFFMVDDSGNMD